MRTIVFCKAFISFRDNEPKAKSIKDRNQQEIQNGCPVLKLQHPTRTKQSSPISSINLLLTTAKQTRHEEKWYEYLDHQLNDKSGLVSSVVQWEIFHFIWWGPNRIIEVDPSAWRAFLQSQTLQTKSGRISIETFRRFFLLPSWWIPFRWALNDFVLIKTIHVQKMYIAKSKNGGGDCTVPIESSSAYRHCGGYTGTYEPPSRPWWLVCN